MLVLYDTSKIEDRGWAIEYFSFFKKNAFSLSGPAARDGLILFRQDKTRSGEKVTVQLGRFSAERLKGGEISLSFVNIEPKN